MHKHAFMQVTVSFAGLHGVNPQGVCVLLCMKDLAEIISNFFSCV